MQRQILFWFFIFLGHTILQAQCPNCGNGIADAGETNTNCPQDVPHGFTCTSPCGQPGAFETTAGIRISEDFGGTTTFGAAALPAGWAFRSAPTPSTDNTLATAGTDAYGAKAGLVQPNCSGSCTSTNGFCIGNLANFAAGGKLGCNFDGRTNVTQNLSYAVLRGQNSPTLVSPTYNMSAVEGFKIQIWLFPSETSCGQMNSWGSCTGNVAFLDFSANGGTSWTQIMTLNISSSNTDMCFSSGNTSNTLWLRESSWSRLCLTVFKTTNSPGNFYTAASGTTAPSGIMVSNTWFVSTFKYRIRYSQSALCTSGITTTNPGRYLAVDFPVITSGNQMIPCGISFANLCGYGADNNDDGVGGTGTSTNTVFGTTRRGVNQAERGVEIFTSQNASFLAQNTSGSGLASNHDLCNAEGGDKQCIDWNASTNSYTVVYECIADWEAASGTGINVQYYEGTTPQSVGMTKVTAIGKTATFGWRYTASRFVSCGNIDLNPGCNGYHFLSGSLPTQFARGFYGLAVNSTGQSWSFYGATSCSHYYNGPFFAPIAVPDILPTETDYTVCNASNQLVFTGTVDYCSGSTVFSGSASLSVSGPNGFSETITAGAMGAVPITTAGDYTIKANAPASPAQCIDCGRTVCVTLTAADITGCIVVANSLEAWESDLEDNRRVHLHWRIAQPNNMAHFTIERSTDGLTFETMDEVPVTSAATYDWLDVLPVLGANYYRLKINYINGNSEYSNILVETLPETKFGWACPNPTTDKITVFAMKGAQITLLNSMGMAVLSTVFEQPTQQISVADFPKGVYILHLQHNQHSKYIKIVKE